MLVAAALSVALLQDPVPHAQAVTCAGLFANIFVLTSQLAENEPNPENRETAALAAAMLKVADADRLAAASREGISVDDSGARLSEWIAANPDIGAMVERDLDTCLGLYFDRAVAGA